MKMNIINYKEVPFESLSLLRKVQYKRSELFANLHGVALVKVAENQYKFAHIENLCCTITDKKSVEQAEHLINSRLEYDKKLSDTIEQVDSMKDLCELGEKWFDYMEEHPEITINNNKMEYVRKFLPVDDIALSLVRELKRKAISIPTVQKNQMCGIDIIKLVKGPSKEKMILKFENTITDHEYVHIALVKDWSTNEVKLFLIEFEHGTYSMNMASLYLKSFKISLKKYECEEELLKRWSPDNYLNEYNLLQLKIQIFEELVSE